MDYTKWVLQGSVLSDTQAIILQNREEILQTFFFLIKKEPWATGFRAYCFPL